MVTDNEDNYKKCFFYNGCLLYLLLQLVCFFVLNAIKSEVITCYSPYRTQFHYMLFCVDVIMSLVS